MTFSAPQMSSQHLPAFSKNWLWFLVWGIVLELVGLLAISAAVLTTFISVIVLGLLLLVGGVIVIIDAFTFWRGKGGGFFLHILMGILYLIAGFILVKNPVLGSVSITLFLGIFYILLGLSRLTYSLAFRMPKWGWSFLNGAIALLLGILIMANWPASSLVIIGLFVGIDLLFCGWAYMMAGIAAKGVIDQAK